MSYAYEGVKFRTEMVGSEIPDDPRLPNLKRWCKLFDDQGLAPPYDGGSYGNLSFRTEEGPASFIITASNSGLGDSNDDDRFVAVPRIDLEKGIVYARGTRKPSSESMVHFAIYSRRPNVNAIFHGHCEIISAYAEKAHISVTRREEQYGTTAIVDRVLEVLGERYIVEMRNHGFIALGANMDDAGRKTLDALTRCEMLHDRVLQNAARKESQRKTNPEKSSR